MKFANKQQGSDVGTEKTAVEEKKGLEFMALRFNVVDTLRYLKRNKLVTPSESFLLDEIIYGTIGASGGFGKIRTEAEFFIRDLSENLGYKEPDRIWSLLKSLQDKYLICRNKTRNPRTEVISLNPYFFGQILIDKSLGDERKVLRLAVDNTAPQPNVRARPTDEPSVARHESVGTTPMNHPVEATQVVEITGEKRSLEGLELYKDLKEKNSEKTRNFIPSQIGIGDDGSNPRPWSEVPCADTIARLLGNFSMRSKIGR